MRELKFRAWDKNRERMINFDEVPEVNYNKCGNLIWCDMENLAIGLDGTLYLIDECGNYESPEAIGENYVIMQYTGLKDRKNKEIYERDIVKDYLGNIHEVKYSNGRWCAPLLKKVSPHWGAVYLDCVYMDWEVIGNVFENPELLEGGAE